MQSRNSDVRTGGHWTTLQRLKNDAIWIVAASALAVCRHVSLEKLRTVGRTLGKVACLVARPVRRTALENIARVFPEMGERARQNLVRACFTGLGAALGETVAMLGTERREAPLALTGHAQKVVRDAMGEGRGVVFASAHLGPWEQVAAALATAGIPLVAVVRESYDPRFSRLFDRLRRVAGVRVIWRGTPGATARILRTLRRGEVLGLPMDLCARVPSIQVPFLGHMASTAVGPARIALKTRAPVVVGTAALADGKLVVSATRILAEDLRPGPAGDYTLTLRINDELSRRILDLPHAWPWMHPRWSASTEV